MKNKEELVNELRQELNQTIDKIKNDDDKFPIEVGLLKIITDLDAEMKKTVPDKKELEKVTFGIFRLLTESYSFQKSILGAEILNLHKNIKQFIKDFY